ncbi:LysR family transcriptional regulator [Thaumasiovibrio sp. DFM-14]|uniref:LysR family transcriptional regulator n=1 Tax=Thaumasiovibrio sp. DFM-14 TaxID=3384792 RepID=UPI0039A2C402
MITIEQIHSFRHVYLHGSYSAAAKVLGKKRNTVRELVIALEDSIHVELFEISGRKAIPTDAAHHLFLRAQNLSKHAEDFELTALSLSKTTLTTLNINYDNMLPVEMLAEINAAIEAVSPRLAINWRQTSRQQAYEALENNQCHLALMAIENAPQTQARVAATYIGALSLACFCRADSELAQTPTTVDGLRLATQLFTDCTTGGGVGYFKVSNTVKTVGSFRLLLRIMDNNSWVILAPHNAEPYVKDGTLAKIALLDKRREFTYGISLFHSLGGDYRPEINQAINIICDVTKRFLV